MHRQTGEQAHRHRRWHSDAKHARTHLFPCCVLNSFLCHCFFCLYTHVHVHMNMQVHMCECVSACVHVCVRACGYVCEMCVDVSMCGCVGAGGQMARKQRHSRECRPSYTSARAHAPLSSLRLPPQLSSLPLPAHAYALLWVRCACAICVCARVHACVRVCVRTCACACA